MNASERTRYIKEIARSYGFAYIGIAKARRLDEEESRLDAWLRQNMHGKMSYMTQYFDKRLDPTLLVDGAKSVISLMYNYYTEKKQIDAQAPKISIYAYGKDYHIVLKKKLKSMIKQIQQKIGSFEGRIFVDSAPVMERQWAREAGLGWLGKNTLLINKQSGSYFFLAEIICDLELEYDHPLTKDYCGTCTACIDACPTDAIQPYVVNASKCISYLTIELKDAIPAEFAGKMNNWMFGCDICQQVCPWNRFSVPHQEPQFEPSEELLNMTASQWEEITEEVFNRIFKNSAVKRTKFIGLKRNIKFLKQNPDEQ
jgi:epoxyqueuosine reductase